MDSFFYFVEDEASNALVLKQISYDFASKNPTLQQKELVLQKILMTEKLLQLPYAKVSICYSSTQFTIVPEELYNKQQLRSYLSQVTRLEDTTAVNMCRMSKLGSHIVYGVDKVILDVMKSYFPGAGHLHIISPLVMQSYQHAQHHEGAQVFVHVGNGIMGIVVFENAQLQLVNTFQYKTELDFMYYILLIYDQFNLDPETVPVLISGRAEKKTEQYDQLSKYVKNIQFIQAPSYYHYSSVFQDVNFHYYRDLLSMKLCV